MSENGAFAVIGPPFAERSTGPPSTLIGTTNVPVVPLSWYVPPPVVSPERIHTSCESPGTTSLNVGVPPCGAVDTTSLAGFGCAIVTAGELAGPLDVVSTNGAVPSPTLNGSRPVITWRVSFAT